MTTEAAEPIVLSWSGGKDSSLALHALRADPRFEVVGLLTSVTRGHERISIHGVRRELLEAQAVAIGLPLFVLELQPRSSNDAYEAAFLSALAAVRVSFPELRRVAFGDLYLEDVRAFREALLARAELSGHYPIWGRDTAELAREFVDLGFKALLVCVDTTQLDGRFAGRSFDHELLAELPSAVDPCGEGGEFHTFVYGGPIFTSPVACVPGEFVFRDSRFMYHDLLPG